MKYFIRNFLIVVMSLSFSQQSHAELGYNVLDRALTEWVITNYSKVKTPEQFVQAFASARPQADKDLLLTTLRKLPHMPRLKRIENGFEIAVDSESVKVDMRTASTGRFVFNNVVFFAGHSLSFQDQADIYFQKLRSQKKTGDSALFRLLVSESQAGTSTVLKDGAIFVGIAISAKVVDRYGNGILDLGDTFVCWVTIDRGSYTKPAEEGVFSKLWCPDYKKKKEDLLKKMPENEAVADAMKQTPPKDKSFNSGMEKCPDKDHPNYYGYVTFIQTSADSNTAHEDMLRIVGEFNGDKIKDVKVYDVNADKAALIATYNLDAQFVLTDIVIPNPALDAPAATDPSSVKKVVSPGRPVAVAKSQPATIISPTITISATAEDISDPTLKAQQSIHKAIFTYFAGQLAACKANQTKEQGKKAEEEKTNAGPAIVQPASDATVTAPAVK